MEAVRFAKMRHLLHAKGGILPYIPSESDAEALFKIIGKVCRATIAKHFGCLLDASAVMQQSHRPVQSQRMHPFMWALLEFIDEKPFQLPYRHPASSGHDFHAITAAFGLIRPISDCA